MRTTALLARSLPTAALAVLAACSLRPPEPPGPRPGQEVRALWVVRTTLRDPTSIREMVRRAADAGYNTLIVQVRGRGDAFYRSRFEPRSDMLDGQPEGFDPLALTVREAHARGLAVHAWLNTHLLANADALPEAATHLFNRRPDLLAVPRPLAPELNAMDPQDPRFREALVRYARENRNRIEGVYTVMASPVVQEHLLHVWLDVLEHYDVDGVHFDYVRFPAPEFDYSRIALARFREWQLPRLSPDDAARLGPLAARDPLAFADSFPEAYSRFRRDQITNLVARISKAVKARRPSALVSAAVFANSEDAYENRFQDWLTWLREGWLDVACPMAYTTDTDVFREQIRVAAGAAGPGRIWAGIGAYRNTPEGTLEKLEVSREIGTAGFVFFSYGSLVRPDSTSESGGRLLERLAREAW